MVPDWIYILSLADMAGDMVFRMAGRARGAEKVNLKLT